MLFVGLAAGTYSSIFLATPIVADLKEREPEQQALRKRVLARRAAAAPAGRRRVPARSPAPAAAPGGRARRSPSPTATSCPARSPADVVVESPVVGAAASRARGGTAAPRPGARPQRPGQTGPSGKKRR